MSNRDKLINSLIKEQIGPMNATKRLQEQIFDQQIRAIGNINKMALEAAAQSLANFHSNYAENIYKHIGSMQLRLLNDFKFLNISNHLAGVVRQTLIPLSEYYSSSATRMMAQIGESISGTRTDWARAAEGIARLATREIDSTRIAGSSISAAIAALQLEQAKGFESLRESFAGTVAEALKQLLEAADKRDERAFARFEQLIDDKISTLPHNQVTAESLWQFLLMLLIALGSLGTSLYQVKEASQSSAAQSEQSAQIMGFLERITHSIEQLIPKSDENTYYVVERQVELKVKPTNRSYPITIIFPNQKVRLIQMNHQWIYIEYFDYLEGIPKYGWATKKYLKRVSQ